MASWLSSRRLLLALFLACTGMMAFGYYLQYRVGLAPCPLCITQRVFIVAVGLVALVGALHGPRTGFGVRVYASLGLLFALGGAGFATRHVWLQITPNPPACGPPLEYMFQTFPFLEALKILLRGDGECAKIDWTLLGLSIPAWTLIGFVVFAALLAWTALNPRPRGAP